MEYWKNLIINYLRTICFILLPMWLLLVSLAGCNREQQEIVSAEEEQKEFPSQEVWNSKFYKSKAGRLQAVVRYGHMKKYDKSKVLLFDGGVEVDFYDGEGNHNSHLTSDEGEYHEDTEDVIGLGNVVVVSDSGMTLRTEVLRWDNRLEKIRSDTTVMVTTQEHDTLYGVGFESEPDLSRWIILKPWGVSERRVDIEKMEESFSRPSRTDSIPKQDSTKNRYE